MNGQTPTAGTTVAALAAVGILAALGIMAVWTVWRGETAPMGKGVEGPGADGDARYTPKDVGEAFEAGRMVERTVCQRAHGAPDLAAEQEQDLGVGVRS